MQKLLLDGINPCLFSPHFAFSHEGTQHNISHNAFQGSRNASNKSIIFLDFQYYFRSRFIENHNFFVF
jgi:hypothetical protein